MGTAMWKSATILLVFLAAILPVQAEQAMTADEIKATLSGNTAEGQLLKWGISHQTYFHTSGEFRRVDGNGNKGKGKWYVDNYNHLCFEARRSRCRIIKKRDDGGYNMYNRKEELIATFDKIVPGNPHDL